MKKSFIPFLIVGLFLAANFSYAQVEYVDPSMGGQGFLLGDGALNYGREKIWETYYNLHIWRGIYVGGDVQRVWNPGYNRDRGPVSVFSLRMHIEDAANFGNSH